MTAIYVLVSAAVVALVIFAILKWFRHMEPLAIGAAGSVLFAYLFMIKYRCMTGDFNCGFMGFQDGFTWHFWLGLAIAVAMWCGVSLVINLRFACGIRNSMRRLAAGSYPLLGLVIPCVWETLPRSLIHTPDLGGRCPDIPVICHDVAVLGFGGLPFLTIPFLVWALAVTLTTVKRGAFSTA